MNKFNNRVTKTSVRVTEKHTVQCWKEEGKFPKLLKSQ